MKRCDLFYKKTIEKENWSEYDLCDPPTEPREGIHILIDELLGKDWYVAMPENDNQVITQAIYQIIYKYIDEPKKKERIWGILIIICAFINIIIFFIG